MAEKPRILIVDDDRRMTRTLVDILRVTGFQAEAAHSGPQALEKAEQRGFDCVLTDIRMPEMNGVELHRAIRDVQPDLPVVLMTAYAAEALVREGLQEGVIAALTKPLDLNQLLGFFSSLRKERTVAIVDDDPRFCKTLGDILRVRDFVVTEVVNPYEVADKLAARPQVVLLDMKLNRINGLDVLRQLRERFPALPVILVTGHREEMAFVVKVALELDAHTCLYKPFRVERLLEVLAELRREELRLALRTPIFRDSSLRRR